MGGDKIPCPGATLDVRKEFTEKSDEEYDIGLTFDKVYTLGDYVNEGEFGIVHKAHHVSYPKETLAVKVVDRAFESHEEAARIEVSILSKLRHVPNVIQLIDFYVDTYKMYLVQAFAQGGDLFDRLTEKETYLEREACGLAQGLLLAIHYLHSRHGLVHRDIKAENLLLRYENDDTKFLLCDFGNAKFLPEDGTGSGLLTFCGTPAYTAPEILEGEEYFEHVDVWSTGVLIYNLLAGYLPFGDSESDQMELFTNIQNGDYDYNDPAWDDVSEKAKDLITNLLDIDPKERWTAKEALDCDWFKTLPKRIESRSRTNSRRSRPLSRQKSVLATDLERRESVKAVSDAAIVTPGSKRMSLNRKQSRQKSVLATEGILKPPGPTGESKATRQRTRQKTGQPIRQKSVLATEDPSGSRPRLTRKPTRQKSTMHDPEQVQRPPPREKSSEKSREKSREKQKRQKSTLATAGVLRPGSTNGVTPQIRKGKKKPKNPSQDPPPKVSDDATAAETVSGHAEESVKVSMVGTGQQEKPRAQSPSQQPTVVVCNNLATSASDSITSNTSASSAESDAPKKYYKVRELLDQTVKGLDYSNMQQYLSDDDFSKIFFCTTRAQVATWKEWKVKEKMQAYLQRLRQMTADKSAEETLSKMKAESQAPKSQEKIVKKTEVATNDTTPLIKKKLETAESIKKIESSSPAETKSPVPAPVSAPVSAPATTPTTAKQPITSRPTIMTKTRRPSEISRDQQSDNDKKYYTIKELSSQSVPGLDYDNVVKYLSDNDFSRVFVGETREKVEKWKSWKVNEKLNSANQRMRQMTTDKEEAERIVNNIKNGSNHSASKPSASTPSAGERPDSSSNSSSNDKKYYSIEELNGRSVPGLDYNNVQQYLSDDDFSLVFVGATREEVAKWKLWKVKDKLRDASNRVKTVSPGPKLKTWGVGRAPNSAPAAAGGKVAVSKRPSMPSIPALDEEKEKVKPAKPLYERKKANSAKESSTKERVPPGKSSSQNTGAGSSSSEYYTIEQIHLQSVPGLNYNQGVSKYLSDDDFKSVFGNAAREEVEKWPKWKVQCKLRGAYSRTNTSNGMANSGHSTGSNTSNRSLASLNKPEWNNVSGRSIGGNNISGRSLGGNNTSGRSIGVNNTSGRSIGASVSGQSPKTGKMKIGKNYEMDSSDHSNQSRSSYLSYKSAKSAQSAPQLNGKVFSVGKSLDMDSSDHSHRSSASGGNINEFVSKSPKKNSLDDFLSKNSPKKPPSFTGRSLPGYINSPKVSPYNKPPSSAPKHSLNGGLNSKAKEKLSTIATPFDDDVGSANQNKDCYPLDKLQKKLIPGLDYQKAEKYLSDADFKKVFNATRAEVAAWKPWKIAQVKRKSGLW